MKNDSQFLSDQLKDTARKLRQFQLEVFGMLDAVNGAIRRIEAQQTEEIETEAEYDPGLIGEGL